ncbi:hypothetical protein D3879_18940 [Pseudomonas cavernicola]|uniref:Uncharacterized protein n=1 Tax=Pseudomonas cavernicola TaxID=2320866 RepID=A0A418XCD2_9PSED|nr:hypothetical protein D3879_18940 [Pseudomonas cavernicola]
MIYKCAQSHKVEAGACGVTARAKQMLRAGFFTTTRSAGKKANFMIGLRNFHARTLLFAFTA